MALLEIFLVLVGYTEDNDDGSKGDIMKNRGRSPASHSGGARAKDTLRSGTGSSGRSVASDHEHEENPNVSTHPSGGTIALAAILPSPNGQVTASGRSPKTSSFGAKHTPGSTSNRRTKCTSTSNRGCTKLVCGGCTKTRG